MQCHKWKTIVWLQLHILCNLMKCWSPLCNIYIYIKFNKYFFKNICVNQPMQYFETIVIFWLLGWFKYRRQKAQLVEYLTRDSGFESQSGPSLFIPSRYCLCRDIPEIDRLSPAKGKRLGVIFKSKEHLRLRNLTVRLFWISATDSSFGRASD